MSQSDPAFEPALKRLLDHITCKDEERSFERFSLLLSPFSLRIACVLVCALLDTASLVRV